MGDASSMRPPPTEPQAFFPDPGVDRSATGAIVRVLDWTIERFLADLKADRTSWLDLTGLNAVRGTEEILATRRRYDQDLAGSALVPGETLKERRVTR